MTRRLVAVLVLFDISWALAVFGQQATLPWHAGVSLLMLTLASGYRMLGLAIAVMGMALDAILIQQQVLALSGTPAVMPAHLAMLWLGFGLALAGVRDRLPQASWALALLGGALGSLGYYLGYEFGALDLTPTPLLGVVIIGLCWAGLFPLGRGLLNRAAPLVVGR
ncbi:DUF2878 domain-containing protein [Ferrimonas balearica]|uniref:DUF2878 domain-containing protein n=1 Tax=Ferrimonas balearica TaxID=44012 RepID=UPI001C997262|nr:DUF2878 domain-containing protein [Ferrimonas balearica]MBY5992022.1 DUF2878 domain-containing protein [Ferrimonas balearica]